MKKGRDLRTGRRSEGRKKRIKGEEEGGAEEEVMRRLGFGIIEKKNVPMAAPHLNIKSLSQVATTVRALGQ
jgi:hypothetical protein